EESRTPEVGASLPPGPMSGPGGRDRAALERRSPSNPELPKVSEGPIMQRARGYVSFSGTLPRAREVGGAALVAEVEGVEAAVEAAALPEPQLILHLPLTARDAAVFLLHTAAEIEQALMIQYLYAAYSLGEAATDPEATWQGA